MFLSDEALEARRPARPHRGGRLRRHNGREARFLQVDPIGYKGGPNLYEYANDDPINGRDPTGEWTCKDGSEAQCGAVNAALREARMSLASMPLAQAQEVRAAINQFGKAGQSNGVVIEGGNTGSHVALTHTAHGITTVTINHNIRSFDQLARVSIGSAGGVIAHEGVHIYDERVRWHGRDPATPQERYDTERRAYAVEGYVDRGLHFESRGGYPLWRRGFTDAQMRAGARDNAWYSACPRYGACAGVDAW